MSIDWIEKIQPYLPPRRIELQTRRFSAPKIPDDIELLSIILPYIAPNVK